MEWANPQSDSLDPPDAAGILRPIRFEAPEPWLMKLAPWLPWRKDPTDPARQTQLLNYAPFAAVMWSFFIQGDSIACENNEVPVYDHILAPSQCSEVLEKFETEGFAHDGSSFASLAIAIQAYATHHRFPESHLDSNKHLQKVDSWNFETSFPPGLFEYGYTQPPDVCMMSDEFSGSYAPMALMEVYAGSRMTPTRRFHTSKTFNHVVHALHQAFARYKHDVSIRTDRWNTPEPWHTTLQLIYDDFFLSMGLSAMTGMPTLTGAHDYMHMRSGAIFSSLVSWPLFPSSRDPELAEFFTIDGESSPTAKWEPVPAPLPSGRPVPTSHFATTNPIGEAAYMPFKIPLFWDLILDHLFAYTPNNNWLIHYNPHEQGLEGDSAHAFRHCRVTCQGFDYYMLRYMARFTMTPTRFLSPDQRESTFEIEFEQREFLVSADSLHHDTYTGGWGHRHLYYEYRRYSRTRLSACRSLVRRKHAHDEPPKLHRHDPTIQYWVNQDADPTARQGLPFFLSKANVHSFQKHCRHTTWNLDNWADALTDSLHEYSTRDEGTPWPPLILQ